MAYILDAEFLRGAIQQKADSEIITQEEAERLIALDVDVLEEAFEDSLDNDKFWTCVDDAVEETLDELLNNSEPKP